MSEEQMVELVQRALEHHGIEDRVEAAGQFSPRGQTGGMFAGGLIAGAVYGFAGRSRSKEPTELVFQVSRDGLTTKVHQRVNVRVLELIHEDSSSRIELEGNRLPVTHSKDVIQALSV